MTQSGIAYFLQVLVYVAPTILVAGACLIVAITKMGRYPRPALFVAFAMGLEVVVSLGGSIARALLIQFMASSSDIQVPMIAISILGTLGHGLVLGLLAAAAFVSREPPPEVDLGTGEGL